MSPIGNALGPAAEGNAPLPSPASLTVDIDFFFHVSLGSQASPWLIFDCLVLVHLKGDENIKYEHVTGAVVNRTKSTPNENTN